MRAGSRAFLALSAVFALTLGLLAPGLSMAHAPLDAATNAAVACPHHAAAQQIADHAKPTHSGSHRNMAGCPDCCLAAHLGGAAVLPQRDAAFARPLRAVAARIVYFAVVERAAEPAPLAAANGARAPPAA